MKKVKLITLDTNNKIDFWNLDEDEVLIYNEHIDKYLISTTEDILQVLNSMVIEKENFCRPQN